MVSPDTGRREVERPERDIGHICDGMAKNEVKNGKEKAEWTTNKENV